MKKRPAICSHPWVRRVRLLYSYTLCIPLRWLDRCLVYILGRVLGQRSFALLGIPNGATRYAQTSLPIPRLMTVSMAIATKGAAVLTDRNQLIVDLSEQWRLRRTLQHHLFRRSHLQWRPKVSRVEGRVLSLIVRDSTNYFHWLFDALPRIDLAGDLPYDAVYADLSMPFQRESLELLKVGSLVDASVHGAIQAEELIVPSQTIVTSSVMAQTALFLRKHFLFDARPPHRKLYITRADAERRRMINEEEISELLASRGFERVALTGRTLQGQARLFAEAEIVVSIHGAGLANLAFCHPGTRVVEIFAPRFPCACYEHFCHEIDLRYASLVGETPQRHRDPLYDDVLLAPEKLRGIVD